MSNKRIAWKYVIPKEDQPIGVPRKRNGKSGKDVLLLQERSLRKSRTKCEKVFAAWLTDAGEVFEEQVPVWDKYILDFILPTRRLIVEIDGMHHYSTTTADYDDTRSKDLRTVGSALRIPNQMISEGRKDEVMAMISAYPEYNAVYPDRLCWRLWASKRALFSPKVITAILVHERKTGEIGKRLVQRFKPKKPSPTVESVLGDSARRAAKEARDGDKD